MWVSFNRSQLINVGGPLFLLTTNTFTLSPPMVTTLSQRWYLIIWKLQVRFSHNGKPKVYLWMRISLVFSCHMSNSLRNHRRHVRYMLWISVKWSRTKLVTCFLLTMSVRIFCCELHCDRRLHFNQTRFCHAMFGLPCHLWSCPRCFTLEWWRLSRIC